MKKKSTLGLLFFFSILIAATAPSFQEVQSQVKKNIHLLNSGNAEERVAAIIALGNFGMAAKAAVPTLLIALDDGIAIIRESAAETLGKIGAADEKSILALIKCFSDEDPFISGKAITSLAKIGKPTVGYLTRSLADKKDDVRWCAAIA